MNKFSKRYGFEKPKDFQLESIDEDLKNGLWNSYMHIISIKDNIKDINFEYHLKLHLWTNYFKNRIDEFYDNKTSKSPFLSSPDLIDVDTYIKNVFFSMEWYEIYDFIEYVYRKARTYKHINNEIITKLDKIKNNINRCLINENSAYRLIDDIISPMTNEIEVNEIELSINKYNKFVKDDISNNHLYQALNFLSDKKNPQYRNSIKESISAVERIVNKITGNKNGTLGEELKVLNKHLSENEKIPTSLIEGFKKIYGFTSNEGGIRHAFKDKTIKSDFEDAHLMLIFCSSFVNYLIIKSEKK